jgi:4'-phosphopantetheinyl transferase
MGTWEGLLSQAELERSARFRFEEDRQRYVYGRGLLRELAGSYLGAQPKHLEFSYTANGKPQLTSASKDQGLSFNLSHSGARLLLAFAWNREVGVDVELVRRDVETVQIAQRYFSQAEQRELVALESAEQIPAFFRCWTRKEAYVKAVGGGLSLPLSQFDVALLPDEPAELLATRPDPAEAARWVLWNLDLGPDYAAALAVSQRPQVPRPS